MRFVGSVLTTICEICEELSRSNGRLGPSLSVFALLMAGLFATGAKGFEAQFNPESFPIQAIPLVEHSAAKRIFTYDQWADYLIYRLYPKKPVFIDGRSDFFGMPIVNCHAAHLIRSIRLENSTSAFWCRHGSCKTRCPFERGSKVIAGLDDAV